MRSRGTQCATLAVLAACLALPAPAAAQQGGPAFDPEQVGSGECADKRYPNCKRLRFAYGPLLVTPGGNFHLVGPVTIEKPMYDGYAVRVDSNLIRARDGKVPPVDIVHLHHGVWIQANDRGGSGFFGTGEEKTVLELPRGYGMRVRPQDVWLLDYMLHNQVTEPETVYLTYEIDYVPRADAERAGIKRVLPVGVTIPSPRGVRGYPVFNFQKGFGSLNPFTGRRECTYPRERCSNFGPYGEEQPAKSAGEERTVTAQEAGTLVWMMGHLHPGGLRDEVDLVRSKPGGGEESRRIFDSEAVYYDTRGPVSWDLSMTVTKPDWRVRVKPGERLRLNAVYETEQASWYEGMGIVFGFIAPGDESGVDPFQKVQVPVKTNTRKPRRRKARNRRGAARRKAAPRRASDARRRKASRRRKAARRCRSTLRKRRGAKGRAAARKRRKTRRCSKPGVEYRTEYAPLDTRGVVTHGHLPENDNYGGDNVRPLPDKEGAVTRSVNVANFSYLPGDLSRAGSEGIPRVPADGQLTFYNADAAAGIWHTITTCEPPCTGRTGISYPLADALPALDSLELGIGGPALQPAANKVTYSIRPREVGLKPGAAVTYFCRVHPFMRGGFKVVE